MKKLFLLFLFLISANSFALDVRTSGGSSGGSSPLELFDDIPLTFGNGQTLKCRWETADANANALVCIFPEGGAVDVPGWIIGDATVDGVDIGLFNGLTDPFFAALSDDGTKYIKISHNGTDALIDVNSGAIRTNDNFIASGKSAFGGDGIISSNRYVDKSQTITTFPTGNDFFEYSNTNLNPASNSGNGTDSFVAHEFILGTNSGNSTNFDFANYSNIEAISQHNGTGNLTNQIAIWGNAQNTSSGDITFENVAGYFSANNIGSGDIPGTIAKAGQFGVAAITGATGGTVARDYTYYAESPLTGGTLTRHYGLYFEDQEFGANSWAVYSDGGKAEFSSVSGKNPAFIISDADVAQPFTSFDTKTLLSIAPTSGTIGGATIAGLTDGDATPLNLRGIFGTASPTTSSSSFRFTGAKANGSGGVQDLGNADVLLEFVNNSLTSFPAFMCTGGRLCAMSTQSPSARLDISSNGSDSSTQSFQVTDSGGGNTIFRVRNDSHVTVGATGSGQNGRLNVNGANAAGASDEAMNINATLAAMDGSDNWTGIEFNITNANHTGAGNTMYGINFQSFTLDPDASTSAIKIGSGWNKGIDLASGSPIYFGNVQVVDDGTALNVTEPFIGNKEITSTNSGSIGWSVVTGANTACNTTCTNACVHGWETSAGEVAVDCTDATADKCLCAGAN